MDQSDKIIEVLNDLVKINNDRIEGYEKASNQIDQDGAILKTLFYQMSEESQECRRQLSDKIAELGGDPETEKSTVPGKVYRVWMDIKATFAGDDNESTLEACEFGEDAAQKAYKVALTAAENFPDDVKQLILSQKNLLKMSHDLVRNRRDEYKRVVH